MKLFISFVLSLLLVPSLFGASVNLAWDANAASQNVTIYKVYRNGVFLANSTGITFTDPNASNTAASTYHVTAVNVTGESGPSNTVTFTPPPPAPAPPTNLRVVP